MGTGKEVWTMGEWLRTEVFLGISRNSGGLRSFIMGFYLLRTYERRWGSTIPALMPGASMQMLTVLWRWGTLYFQITEYRMYLAEGIAQQTESPATPML